MKILLSFLAFACAGCLDDEPVDVDDVIPSFTIVTAEEKRIADGRSPIEVQVCRAPDTGISRTLNATLRTSAGAWQTPDAEVKTATVPMSMPCESRSFSPTTDAGSITVTATIDTFTRTLPLTLRMAPVERVRLGRQGSLSATESSTLMITASLDIIGNGKPSAGTLVTFNVVVQTPAGATAYVSDRQMQIGQGSSVQTSLVVAQGVTSVTVTASATPEGQATVMSDPLVITP